MQQWLIDLGLSSTQSKLVITAALLLVLFVVRQIVVGMVIRRTEDEDVWYRTRKISTYSASVVFMFGVAAIWIAPGANVGTFLGLASAGIAISLQDLLKNIAGWIYVVLRRPYRVGDRIEVGRFSGDVVDIRLFKTTLLEIGNWVEADQSTGRLIHMPNAMALTEGVANSTEGFDFIWHEVPVLVTFESDWKRAEELVLKALRDCAPDVSGPAAQEIRTVARQYRIRFTHLTPTVYVSVRDSGVLVTGRVLIPPRRRRAVEQAIWRELLDDINADPTVELAYPTIRAYTGGHAPSPQGPSPNPEGQSDPSPASPIP